MIDSIRVEGFRGLKELELSSLRRINVIVGRNNSGKSTLLEALSLFLGSSDPGTFGNVLHEILIWRGWYGIQTVDDLFYNGGDSFSISSTGKTLEALNSKHSLEFKLNGEPFYKIDRESIRRLASQAVLLARFSPKENFEFLTPLTFRRFGYAESLYSYAYERKVVKDSIKVLNEAYPEVEGFSPLLKEDNWVLYVETKYGVYPYYLMGEGFKSAMIISFLSSLLRDGVLLIDSAEAFHHPKSLKVMIQTLVRGSEKNNVQVFLTTHSLELLDLMLEMGRDGFVIYMKNVEGRIEVESIEFQRASELRESIGVDLRGF